MAGQSRAWLAATTVAAAAAAAAVLVTVVTVAVPVRTDCALLPRASRVACVFSVVVVLGGVEVLLIVISLDVVPEIIQLVLRWRQRQGQWQWQWQWQVEY